MKCLSSAAGADREKNMYIRVVEDASAMLLFMIKVPPQNDAESVALNAYGEEKFRIFGIADQVSHSTKCNNYTM